jgi:hypothetical protein
VISVCRTNIANAGTLNSGEIMIKDKRRVRTEMSWLRPRLVKREYELNAAGTTVARLHQTGFLRAQAELLEVDGLETRTVLELSRTGLFRQYLHVKSLDFRLPTMAPALISWNGRTTLVLDNGLAYTWRPNNLWQTHWVLSDDTGAELIHIKRNPLGYGGNVNIEPNEIDADRLLFMLYVGWYLVILKMDDAAAAAASAS